MSRNRQRRLQPAFVIWIISLTIPTLAYASAEVTGGPSPEREVVSTAETASWFTASTRSEGTLREGLTLERHRQQLREVRRRQHLVWVKRQLEKRDASPPGAQTQMAKAPPAPGPEADPVPAPGSTPRPDWYAIAQCESGGDWTVNTGNGFWGGLQFLPSTWFAYGGGPFDGVGPFPYSAAQQIAVAERVLDGQGPQAWPNCFQWM